MFSQKTTAAEKSAWKCVFFCFFTFPQTTLRLLFQTFCWNLSEKQQTNKQTRRPKGVLKCACRAPDDLYLCDRGQACTPLPGRGKGQAVTSLLFLRLTQLGLITLVLYEHALFHCVCRWKQGEWSMWSCLRASRHISILSFKLFKWGSLA